jgi:hypothetical protein
MRHAFTFAVVGSLAVSLASAPAAYAQDGQSEFVNARPVWENVSAGAVSARRPGRMVQAGNLRFQEAHNAAIAHAQNGPEITEEAPAVDEGSALRAELIAGLFEGVNNTITAISAAIGLGLGLDDGTDDGTTAPDLTDLLGVITDSEPSADEAVQQANTG